MHKTGRSLAVVGALLGATFAPAQIPCQNGVHVEGTITDPTGAIVANARVQNETDEVSRTNNAGRYNFPCLTRSFTLRIQAEGFAEKTVTHDAGQLNDVTLDLELVLPSVETQVQVSGSVSATLDANQGPDTVTLDTQMVKQLADDPDDFLRQLQVLASEGGGDPSSARITVDGFQNATVLPPKGSISSIRVNPDLFSAEYRWPPFSGGLIEITTKPGAPAFHGAVFFTGSDGSWNATTAFAPTPTPASKRRYGFELSGAIIPNKGDFSMALEKRDIDEFRVVNAQTLSSEFTIVPFQQTVTTPQRLWMGSLRSGWQLGSADTLTGVFAANVNNLGNQGVSALVLPQSAYTSIMSQYDLRFSNVLTLGSNQLHQTRVGLTWIRAQNIPNSTAPSLQVAGYFTSGGAVSQDTDNRSLTLELDHDVLLTHGKNTLKMGSQSLAIFTHNYVPNTFNGAFLFGGGSAPALDGNNKPTGQTTTVDGMEQYRRTLLGLPGGAPTTYQVTTGEPNVPFTQWQETLYAEDTIQLAPRLTMAGGLRYQMQTAPDTFANFEPRLGFGWSPDKQSKWVFHLRAGIFQDAHSVREVADIFRLNGVRQRQETVYSPRYNSPLAPTADSIAVTTVEQFAPSLTQKATFAGYFNGERDFAHQWHARVNFYWGEDWKTPRIRNINAPMVATTVGIAPDPTAALRAPRPYGGSENILRYENSGHLAGNVVSMSLDQHSYKRFQFHASYRHMNFKANGGDGVVSPQSSYSEQGESARADWLTFNAGSFFGSLFLPKKLEISAQFDASSGASYTITTGTDANGDGIVNDRPAYASATTSGVLYHTRYGLMTADTTNGNVPRNVGTMPATVHLDMNLSRDFVLNPKNAEHLRTLTFNVRSANVLNHTNINGVGTIVSSPSLDQPYQAEAARRIEAGARFSF